MGADVVILRNGGMIRGTLIELIPNDHATVQMANGQSAIIQWGEIHHIERGMPAPPPPPAVYPQPGLPPAAPKILSGPAAFVHIESTRPVQVLYSNSKTAFDWDPVCESPCDAQLPIEGSYKIRGSGMVTSSEFRLSAQPGQRVVLHVSPGAKSGIVWGSVLAGVGVLSTLIGLVVISGADAQDQTNQTCASTGAGCTSTGNTSTTKTTGGVFLVGGLVGIGVGVLLIIVNASTGHSQEVLGPSGPEPRSADLLRPLLRF
jgi:hypothetical protein